MAPRPFIDIKLIKEFICRTDGAFLSKRLVRKSFWHRIKCCRLYIFNSLPCSWFYTQLLHLEFCDVLCFAASLKKKEKKKVVLERTTPSIGFLHSRKGEKDGGWNERRREIPYWHRGRSFSNTYKRKKKQQKTDVWPQSISFRLTGTLRKHLNATPRSNYD